MRDFTRASVAEVFSEAARKGRLVRLGDIGDSSMSKFSVAADRCLFRFVRNVRVVWTSERCRKISRIGLSIGYIGLGGLVPLIGGGGCERCAKI